MTKKILITGITGFVGSHLADYIIDNKLDVEIYGLKRWHLSNLKHIKHIIDKVNLYDCDITDPISSRRTLEEINPDIIFHCAAESFVSPSWMHPTRYMSVNYNGTLNLLEALNVMKSKAIFHIPGSGEEYGEIYESELPINPETVLRPVNPYAVSKIAQDLIGYVYFRSYGLNVIRIRTFNHEGPRRDNVFGIPWFAYQIARIEEGIQPPIIKTGHIDDRRNFTHINDIVNAYWIALEKCNPGELYLIGSDENEKIHSYREIIEMLLKMSSVKGIKIEEDPQYVRPTSVPRLIGDTSKFRNLTNWKPKISIDKTLEDTLEYWRYFVKNNLY